MDLFNLKKSRLRQRLLELYFSHPEKSYYLRELERRLKKPVAYIRRELLDLQKAGLFISEFQGKERFFSLNKNFPLYKETEKIVSKTIGIEADLTARLKKIGNIRAAFIFGSFARGEMDHSSDIDLMVIGNPIENKLVGSLSRLELAIDREINCHIYRPAEFKARIKEKNSFINSVLKKPKIFLIGNEKELPGSD